MIATITSVAVIPIAIRIRATVITVAQFLYLYEKVARKIVGKSDESYGFAIHVWQSHTHWLTGW